LGGFLPVGLVTEVRERWLDTQTRWRAVGSVERRRGYALASHVVSRVMQDILSWLGNSAQLKQLVREQSLGLGSSALDRIRSETAHADQVVGTWFTRRGRRRAAR
jgi:hypothetical protein